MTAEKKNKLLRNLTEISNLSELTKEWPYVFWEEVIETLQKGVK